jgi:hypothetical protein
MCLSVSEIDDINTSLIRLYALYIVLYSEYIALKLPVEYV